MVHGIPAHRIDVVRAFVACMVLVAFVIVLTTGAWAADESVRAGSDMVILESAVSISVSQDGTYESHIREVRQYLTQNGIATNGEIQIPYNSDFEQVVVDYARVTNDQAVVEVSPSSIRDVDLPVVEGAPAYSGVKNKVITLPGLKVGSIVEYQVTVKATPMIPGHFFMSFAPVAQFPTEEYRLEIQRPESMPLAVSASNTEVQPAVEVQDGVACLTWSTSYDGMTTEPCAPDPSRIVPMVMVSSMSSWSDLYDWFHSNAGDIYSLDEAMESKLRELTNGLDRADALRAVYNFVASEVRYVGLEYGINGYIPRPARSTFANLYGDCKDKATLLIAFFRALGVEALPALISTRTNEIGFVDPQSFDHMIVAVPDSSGYVWLDPTPFNCMYGDLPPFDIGKTCLVFTADGARLVSTPIQDTGSTSERIINDVTLVDDKTIQLKTRIETAGVMDMSYRQIHAMFSGFLVTAVQQMAAYSIPGYQISDVRVENADTLDQPIVWEVDAVRSGRDVVAKFGSLGLFQVPNGFTLIPFASYANFFGAPSRTYDFDICQVCVPNFTHRIETTVHVPEGHSLGLPEPIEFSNEMGRVTRIATAIEDGARVDVTLEVTTNKVLLSHDEYLQVQSLINEAAQAAVVQMVLQ